MRVIGKALYGSQTYHLNGPQSDKDYKVIIAPDFIDLYNGKDKYSLPVGYDKEHNSAMDFRQFDAHLRKGNANTIDLIFSPELSIFDDNFVPYIELARRAYEDGYLGHVWPYFFASAKGRTMNSLKRYSGTEEGRRKAASRGFWTINFISAIIHNNYKLTSNIYNSPLIYKHPREIRYEDDAFIPLNEIEWLEMFEYLEIISTNNPPTVENYLLQYYENQLMICAQNTIAAAIKKELEDE